MASWCSLLVQLLEHPRGISVAENITDSLSHRQRRKDRKAHSSQPLCMRCNHLEQVYDTTLVSSALVAPCSLSPCDYKAGEGFHWGCTLCYLMSPTLSINATELTQWVIKVLSFSELTIPNDSKEIMWWSCDGLVRNPDPFHSTAPIAFSIGTWRMTDTENDWHYAEQKGSGGVVIKEHIALVQISTQR